MAGRGLIHPALVSGRGVLPGQLIAGPGIPPSLDGFMPLEHKLATQHAEIQRLFAENQRLAAIHAALRQELAVTQQEIPRLQQVLMSYQAEKEQQVRGLTEKVAKYEADLHATEPLKAELQKYQAEAQNMALLRQELTAQVQQLSQELQRSRIEAPHISVMKSDIEALGQEVQRARTAFEYEKKANTELLEQRQAMEKNLVTLAREVEKLRTELASADKKPRVAEAYGGYGSASDYSHVQPNIYGDRDGYGIREIGAENAAAFAARTAPGWGAYDLQRSGSRR